MLLILLKLRQAVLVNGGEISREDGMQYVAPEPQAPPRPKRLSSLCTVTAVHPVPRPRPARNAPHRTGSRGSTAPWPTLAHQHVAAAVTQCM